MIIVSFYLHLCERYFRTEWEVMSNNCQVPTPEKYVLEMLDSVGYHKDLYGKRVLENSCGRGNVLVEIVKRYIEDARRQNLRDEQIVLGLHQDIIAYEIDAECIAHCRQRLDAVAEAYGLKNVPWTINHRDFLKEEREEFQFIAGNPPYITYHDLEEEDREYIKEHFSTCTQGRFDYSYAFIQSSMDSLAEGGKLAYLVPHSIMKNKFAGKLRRLLLPYISAIYDYKGTKIFPEALTSPVLIVCEKKAGITDIAYEAVWEGVKKNIPKDALGSKWIFGNIDYRKDKKFSDFFEISNSVATLCNKAFLLPSAELNGDYYIIGEYKVEKEIVRDAVSKKSVNQYTKNQKTTKIIFPYQVQNRQVSRYSKEMFSECFPEACRYLMSFCEELKARKADENAMWFEYGRSQAVTNVIGDKLVIPMVITKGVAAHRASFDAIPYAGYFIKQKAGSPLQLSDAKRILESTDFYDYVQECGTPTTPTSYRVSVNDIKDYRFE